MEPNISVSITINADKYITTLNAYGLTFTETQAIQPNHTTLYLTGLCLRDQIESSGIVDEDVVDIIEAIEMGDMEEIHSILKRKEVEA